MFYLLYRAILCDHVINHLLDFVNRNVRRKENYRLWLQRTYCVGPFESEKLYVVIRPRLDDLGTRSVVERSALIHMGFQAGIISLAFSVYTGLPGCLIGLSFLAGALIADIRIEDQVRMILQSSQSQFDETARAAIAPLLSARCGEGTANSNDG